MTDNKVNFDKYTDNYNELLRENTGFFSTEEYFAKYKVDLVRNRIGVSPKRVLEYGCGIGRNIGYLKLAKLLQCGFWLPAQHPFGFFRIADQQLNLGRPVELGIDLDEHLAGLAINPDFLLGLTFPHQVETRRLARHGNEIAHRFRPVGRQHVGIRRIRLEHAPHALNVLPGKTPVALRIHVAELQHILFAHLDPDHAVGNLARHELTATQGRFMVEQDAAASKDTVRLAIIDGHPVRVELGDTIGTARIERRRLDLGKLLHLAEHLGGACLIEANPGVDDTNRFQQIQSPQPRNFRRGNRLLERNPDKALRREVIDFRSARLLQHADAGGKIGQIVFDQVQVRMLVNAKLFDAPEIDRTGSPESAIDFVAFIKQKLGQICSILAGNASDQCCFHFSQRSDLKLL